MIWFILLLSFLIPINGMDRTRKSKRGKLAYTLPNAFRPKDPDKPDLPAYTFQVMPRQFDQIETMSDSFAHHIQDESTYLEADVQDLFNKMQHAGHNKKPTKSHEEIAQSLQAQVDACRKKLSRTMSELSNLESRQDDEKYLKLDLLEKEIISLSRELMTLSHTRQLHRLYTTKKRIEKVTRQRMNIRLQSLFSLLESTKKQLEDAENLP
jgi:hypothetical protein